VPGRLNKLIPFLPRISPRALVLAVSDSRQKSRKP
jgi:hypothetical protein